MNKKKHLTNLSTNSPSKKVNPLGAVQFESSRTFRLDHKVHSSFRINVNFRFLVVIIQYILAVWDSISFYSCFLLVDFLFIEIYIGLEIILDWDILDHPHAAHSPYSYSPHPIHAALYLPFFTVFYQIIVAKNCLRI